MSARILQFKPRQKPASKLCDLDRGFWEAARVLLDRRALAALVDDEDREPTADEVEILRRVLAREHRP